MESNKFKLIDGTLFVESIDCIHNDFGGKVERIEFSPELKVFPLDTTMEKPWNGWSWHMRHMEHSRITADRGPFEGLRDLSEVTIPDTVEEVGLRAFKDCINLKKVTFGKNLQRIGRMAFQGCTQLEEISFPAGVDYVSEKAFDGCIKLHNIKISEPFKILDWSAFQGCPCYTFSNFGEYLGQFEKYYKYTNPAMKSQIFDGVFHLINGDGNDVFRNYLKRHRTYMAKKSISDPNYHEFFMNQVDLLVTRNNIDTLLEYSIKLNHVPITAALLKKSSELKGTTRNNYKLG